MQPDGLLSLHQGVIGANAHGRGNLAKSDLIAVQHIAGCHLVAQTRQSDLIRMKFKLQASVFCPLPQRLRGARGGVVKVPWCFRYGVGVRANTLVC